MMALVFRYSSLASLTAAVLAPVIYVLGDGGLWIKSNSIALSVTVMALFLLYRHAENINRLIKGTESKLGKKVNPQVVPGTHHGHHGNSHAHKHEGKHVTPPDTKHPLTHGKHHP